jgi:hypothetical protein
VADEALGIQIEHIPDADSVFMRAHRVYFASGRLGIGVFKARGSGMSVNWDKYASAESTRNQGKEPNANAVISLSVMGVRTIDGLDVKHTPKPDNQAHSDINLPDDTEELNEVRVKLHRLARIVLPLNGSSTQ